MNVCIKHIWTVVLISDVRRCCDFYSLRFPRLTPSSVWKQQENDFPPFLALSWSSMNVRTSCLTLIWGKTKWEDWQPLAGELNLECLACTAIPLSPGPHFRLGRGLGTKLVVPVFCHWTLMIGQLSAPTIVPHCWSSAHLAATQYGVTSISEKRRWYKSCITDKTSHSRTFTTHT